MYLEGFNDLAPTVFCIVSHGLYQKKVRPLEILNDQECFYIKEVAPRGFEPPTHGLGNQRSIP